MEDLRKYGFLAYNTTGAQLINRSGLKTREDYCNGFTAVNTGNDTVTVNDQTLYPGVPGTRLGDSITVGGNQGEVYIGQIKVSFAGVGNNPQLAVYQKFYIPLD